MILNWVNFLFLKFEEIFGIINKFIFHLFHYYVKYYFLKAPRKLFGFEGAEYYDICKELTSISSTHWIENKEICLSTIEKHIGAFTTALLMISVPYFLFYFLKSFKLFTGKSKIIFSKNKANLQRKQTENLKIISKKYISLLSVITNYNLNEPLELRMKEEFNFVLNILSDEENLLEYKPKKSLLNCDTYNFFNSNNSNLILKK
jgi:hypothetical protein